MKHSAHLVTVGGLLVLLAPGARGQSESELRPERAKSATQRPAHGQVLPDIAREPQPASTSTAPRVATSVFVPPTRVGGDSETPNVSLADLEIHDRVHHDVTADGTLWARGADFKASATGDGFQFIPFLGSDAPTNQPVRFRLADVRRPGAEIALGGATAATRAGDRYVIDRGDVEVRYDVALRSVEQSFAFDLPAGDGDLVLSLDVDTDLETFAEGDQLQFLGDRGGVSYGAAVVFDAVGRSADVERRLIDGGIELVVPDAFLDAAVGPIVVDPVLATVTIDGFSAELTDPDLAYDAASDQYMIVFEEVFSGGDTDVYSWFLSGSAATPSDGAYIDSSGDDWTQPAVAAQQNDRTFMVVATSDGTSPGENDIVARTRSAIDGTLAAPFILKGHTASYDCHSPDIGGDNFASSASYFCVVYNRDYGTDVDVAAIIVDVDGNYVAAGEFGLASFVSRDERQPVVSKSTGSASGSTRFNVAWSEVDLNTSEQRVVAGQMSFNGNTVYGPFDVTPFSGTYNYFDVEVSCQSDALAGGAQTWLVAYDDGPSVFTDTFVALCADDTLLDTVELHRSEHTPLNPNHDTPKIGTHAESFAIGYYQEGEQFVTIVQPVGQTIGITERRLPLDSPSPLFLSLTVGTVFEGGGPFADGLFAWSDDDGGDADILGARYFPDPSLQAAGYQYCFGAANSTGDHGFIRAIGDRSTTSNQMLLVSGLPSAFGFFLASQSAGNVPNPGGSQGTLCLGGNIGRFGIYSTAGSGGTASFSVDPQAIPQPTGTAAAMSGQTWRFQSWHRDSVGGSATSNFTNAVAIPFL